MKKFKEEWWAGAKRHRIMHDLLPNLALEKHSLLDESCNFGMKIRPMDHPYLLSPPRMPVTGATRTSKDTVKVMAFHGIVYSHQGLSDPAVMPEYVRQVREAHCGILRYAALEPEFPRWSFVRKGLSSQH